jgi:site-specific recombinase XerD
VWNGDDDKLMDIGRTDVIRFVEVSAEGRSRQTIRTMCSGIRSLLRYLHAEGFVVDDLATSVPSPRTWKHSTLPTYLTAAQLQAVLSHCDRTTATGRRDYAILLLLARLGLRANEVATLKLDDIDWGSGSFSIEGKGGRRAVMPLPADVGTAIVDYVQNGRPKSRCRELFLRVETPCTGFPTAAGVILVAQRVLKRAGIRGLASHGSHVFRHTLATEMIQTGATLAEIGEVLRHQDRDTTRIYAKVDLPRLRLLSLEWPGGAQ